MHKINSYIQKGNCVHLGKEIGSHIWTGMEAGNLLFYNLNE